MHQGKLHRHGMHRQLTRISQPAIASRCPGPRYSDTPPMKFRCVLHATPWIAFVPRLICKFMPVEDTCSISLCRRASPSLKQTLLEVPIPASWSFVPH